MGGHIVRAAAAAMSVSVATFASNLDAWNVGLEERRGEERLRTALRGHVTFTPERGPDAGTRRSLPCTVLNISEGGAKLAVEGGNAPDAFALHIEGEAPRRCRCLRRDVDGIGVRFEA